MSGYQEVFPTDEVAINFLAISHLCAVSKKLFEVIQKNKTLMKNLSLTEKHNFSQKGPKSSEREIWKMSKMKLLSSII